MIRSTFGSLGIAAYRWHKLRARHGDDHPATIAALGRLRYHRGDAPQHGSASVEAVAWYREAGTIPGYRNRRARRASDGETWWRSCGSTFT